MIRKVPGSEHARRAIGDRRLPAVEHGGQRADDHVGLVGISNRGDDLQKLVESQQREVAAAVDRNDDRVGDCQAVERWRPAWPEECR